MLKPILLAVALLGAANAPALAQTGATRGQILDGLAAEAKQADPSFAGFSAQRGAAFYAATPGGGGAETPSCTACHTADPAGSGRSRAGKTIAPMAVSATPDRFTDPAKVAKWFERNCQSVLGRACTAREKGDFIAFLSSK